MVGLRFLLMSGMICLAAGLGSAQSWKPAPVSLMTEWGAKITPENAWREYPRPQLVRKRWQNLNGLWEYSITSKNAAAPTTYEGEILVPFAVEAALSGVGRSLRADQRLWYRRSFSIPQEWGGERILLHFGAVDYECVLWVNGGLVGSHQGGFDSFSFDITSHLRAGRNEIILGVTDSTDAGEQPRGKQQLQPQGIWYTPVSGIWQTVWMEPVPQSLHLAELRLTPDVDAGGVRIVPLTQEAISDDTYAVRVTASAAGQVVATTLLRVNREGFLNIPNPRLWSPADPFLYDLQAELVRVVTPWPSVPSGQTAPPRIKFGDAERTLYARATMVDSSPIESVTSYFGLRKVTLGPGRVAGQPAVLLNGKPLFQHGPLDQGWWPEGLHTPPSDEAMKWEIEWLRLAGFNMLRKHIKVEPARYYYHCDRLGILVWQDMPSGFNKGLRNSPNDAGEPFRLSTSREQHELELRRMLGRLHHFPSIIMWVIFNEGWGQYESAPLAQWVKSIDRSRLVNANSGWLDMEVGEVYDLHTYDPTPKQPSPSQNRAIVLGEYGGVGWPIPDHLWNPQMRNWGYQTYQSQNDYLKALRHKIEALLPMKEKLGLSAAVYTQTTDVEGEVNGWMTYDRKVIKVDPSILRSLNAPLTSDR